MPRKIILDVDPGIDDAVALCLALFDPSLEVLAVTATGGNVPPDQATRNVQAIVEQLDPPRWPRIGAALSDTMVPADARAIQGSDGLGEAHFSVAELHHRHPSVKLLCDEIRAAPEEVTIVGLGPATNLALALDRDPDLASLVGRLVVMGGTYSGPGNITPAAEFNVYCDPLAARRVFQSHVTKTLVPLDVTSQIVMTYGQADQLPGEETRTGRFLRQVLPYAFRAHRQQWGMEGIYLHGVVALISMLHPELFEMQDVVGDVETTGELTIGATVFDRRPHFGGQPNMEIAVGVDAAGVMDCIMRGLSAAD